MQPGEEKIYNQLAFLRTRLFRPLTYLLSKLGVTADTVSYFGVALMVGFVFVAQNHPVAAFWLLFGRMVIDILDGPLARFQKTDSDRGKFVDVLMDNIGFGLFIFGILNAGLIGGLPASIYLFLTELVVVLMIIRFNLKHKSDWFFYASAGSFPYNFMYASYLLFAIYAFGGQNFLTGAAQVFSVLLAVKAATDYWAIQKTRRNN